MWEGKQTFEPLNLNPTPKNIEAAAKLRKEISEKIKHNIFCYEEYFPDSIRANESSDTTFKQVSDNWLTTQTDKALSTLTGYKKIINRYLLPSLGNKPIKHIKYSELAVLLSSFDVSAKTRNNILTPIRQIFEMAHIDGDIEINPSIKLKSAKSQKEPPDPFSFDEIELVINFLGQHYPEPIQNYFEFAFFTGMRTSELIALKWEDVDWNNQLIRDQRAKVLKEIKETKTYVIRDVELNSRAIRALERQKKITLPSTEWIFINPNTNEPFIDDRPVRRWAWTPSLKSLGIRYRPPYNTRHTCATIMLMAGSNPAWAAKQLGHSIEMFLRTYSKWIDGDDKGKELSKIEELISAK